jgi:hypothetical protein
MKRILLIAIAVAVVTAMSVPAWAGTNPNAVITVHAKAHTTKPANTCTTWSPNSGTPIPCTSYVTSATVGVNTDVYVVVAGGSAVSGIAGMSCGVKYSGTPADGGSDGVGADVYGWTLCADLQFTNSPIPGDTANEWPISGGGNRITWVMTTNCQRTVAGTEGVHAVAGAFYVFAYGPDTFALTGNLNLEIPELAVADCITGATDYIAFDLGGAPAAFVTFSVSGTDVGCNPCTEPTRSCIGTPVESSTWGKIKTKYGSK